MLYNAEYAGVRRVLGKMNVTVYYLDIEYTCEDVEDKNPCRSFYGDA